MKTESLHNLINLIKQPVISDKATRLLENNKYTFLVDKKLNKQTIKNLIEYIFDVKVLNVNTLVKARKKRRITRFTGYRTQYKKAIITLQDGNKINIFPEL